MLDLELGRVGVYRDSNIDIADITILYSNTPPTMFYYSCMHKSS